MKTCLPFALFSCRPVRSSTERASSLRCLAQRVGVAGEPCGAAGTQWAELKDAAKCPARHGPPSKD